MNKGSVVIFMLCQLQIKSFLALIQLWWKSLMVTLLYAQILTLENSFEPPSMTSLISVASSCA